jgi:hypothetical protein
MVVSKRAAIRGASSARGIVIMSSVSGGGGVLWVSEGMDVDGVGKETPGLHLLSDLLGVRRGENADFAGFF